MNNILYDNSNLSIIKLVLLFYVLASSNMVSPLLSKQFRELLENNRVAKHVVGLSTMVSLLVITNEGQLDTLRILIYSIIAYMWFIFSTKLDLHWNVIILLSLLGAYLYENSLRAKELQMMSDNTLTEEQKNKIREHNSKMRLVLLASLFGLTLFGLFLYSHKKEGQYGGGYSLTNFLLY